MAENFEYYIAASEANFDRGLIFETIFALKVFDLIYVLTSGGPGKSTSVLGWSIYINTFKKLDFGSGSALAMILGFITLFLAIMFYTFLDRGEKQ